MIRFSIISILISLLCSRVAFSMHFPPAFYADTARSKKVVFVDFLSANYNLSYDLTKKKVIAKSRIIFQMPEGGLPVFDLVPDAQRAMLDGKDVEVATLNFPQNATVARYLNRSIGVGEHVVEIENEITSNVQYDSAGEVKSAFWTSDLDDREFLEQYLPTNFEYDQYKMEMNVRVVGSDKDYEIMTNGQIRQVGHNDFSLDFPVYFNTSSLFFHLMPKNAIPKVETTYKSIDGRDIPVLVYSRQNVNNYKQEALRVLAELEADYGPWPHAKVVIYGAGYGGMEYCGATETDIGALGHELTHSYFARGVMPAQGNSGWIDEAMASWRDRGYRQSSETDLTVTRMAGHSVYTRATDRAAYSSGATFLGFLDKKYTVEGGLKKFMRHFFEEQKYIPYATQTFQTELEKYFAQDLSGLFQRFIYGTTLTEQGKNLYEENPIHRKLSREELLQLL